MMSALPGVPLTVSGGNLFFVGYILCVGYVYMPMRIEYSVLACSIKKTKVLYLRVKNV